MGRVLSAILVAGAVFATGSRVSASSPQSSSPVCIASPPPQLAIPDCRLAAVVGRGIDRSETLRRVVDRIGEMHGRVYVTTAIAAAAGANRPLLGALSHRVVIAGPYCLLHVTVLHNYDDRAVATVAHELQHVVEVLESPEARTEAAVDALFERIGFRVSTGIVETLAAIHIERVVARELRLARNRS